ncbi:MAG: hypothetical protein EOP45_08385 [Sphingobacteriaceae bacterium]|nr:MAG: hypothetical protein EOP45_08385 [Sphingobacteriaceae bacterium]
MSEFLGILIYLFFSLILAFLIYGLSFIFASNKADPEKISAYECGFQPFEDTRSKFFAPFKGGINTQLITIPKPMIGITRVCR